MPGAAPWLRPARLASLESAEFPRSSAPRCPVPSLLGYPVACRKPWALRVPANQRESPLTKTLHAALEKLDIELDADGSRGGVDIGPLSAHGIPFVDLRQDATRYFDFHHTANDVLENVSRLDLKAATRAFCAAVWTLANTDESYRAGPSQNWLASIHEITPDSESVSRFRVIHEDDTASSQRVASWGAGWRADIDARGQ